MKRWLNQKPLTAGEYMAYWVTVCKFRGKEVVQQEFLSDGTPTGNHRILDLTGVTREGETVSKQEYLTFYRTTDGHSNIYIFEREDGKTVRVGPNTTVGELHNRL